MRGCARDVAQPGWPRGWLSRRRRNAGV